MGAWGVRAFDNDEANDWAYDLEDKDDLSLIETALNDVEETGIDYLDSGIACSALAACEVLARLRGQSGYSDAYTEKVDVWVTRHPNLKPSKELMQRALNAITRITGEKSELKELWEESDGDDWKKSVEELRVRLAK